MKRLSILFVTLAAPAFANDASAPVAGQALAPFNETYLCAGSRQLTVRYPAYVDAAREPIALRWRQQNYSLTRVQSASGARYVNRQLIWWTKGDKGFLTTRGGRMMARDCQAQ
ncbi:MliC family protein [Crenobacter cavernae]|uniref:C-type lysozyme inhibitor domain-containing protein n=1 Tax=Crenobacter cavernae TaxID=2290923 RepID=A0ABY0FF77_9NEIS|nr:MliC family protein [Crenobacter cavernae]RXZ43709.1 hypothetical protein EBB06_08865 [Crenobacter cavernae]